METNNRITILANFRIDSKERLSRMKDSFASFSNANIEAWILNIRGPFMDDAVSFFKLNVKQDLKIFKEDSKLGWKHDTKVISQYVNTTHVMVWVEDHICISGYKIFNKIISEIIENRIDYLCYSWFQCGDNLKSFSKINYENNNHIISLNYDKKICKLRSEYINEYGLQNSYLISMCSIISKKLLIDLVSIKDPWISRWSKFVPFDFEKNQFDTHWLPFKLGVLKQELFAAIDDDNGYDGYSLISRGEYYSKISREEMLESRNQSFKSKNKFKDQILKFYFARFFYYKIVKMIIYLREMINRFYAKFFFNR